MSRVESEDQRQKQHLRSALAAREAGDIRLALQEVYAALSIDPDYLAARLLCESLTDKQRPLALGHEFPDEAMLSQPQGAGIGAGRPGAHLGRSADGRDSVEVVEFDPAWPAMPETAAELQTVRARTKLRHRILWVAVTAGVAGLIAGTIVGLASQLHREPRTADVVPVAAPLGGNASSGAPPVSVPMLSAELHEAPEPVLDPQNAIPRARSNPRPSLPLPPPPPRARINTPAPAAGRGTSVAVPEHRSPLLPAFGTPGSPAPAVERPSGTPLPVERLPETPPAVSPRVETSSEASPALADDSALIRDALQRYQRAYNALDARLAHAVYPGVDEAALQHAFEGLRSQSLEFEACSVDALAQSARAVCRGSARYVPKIGSREPRAERRVWTFRLKKDDGDWRIESAWTDR